MGLLNPRWARALGRNAARGLCTDTESIGKPIVAAAVLERLPFYPRPPHPTVAKFKELSAKWKRMIGEIDVLENSIPDLHKAPAPTVDPVAESSQVKDRRSLRRALDDRLYLIVHGTPYQGNKSKPVWHFPEKVYVDEDNLRKCAECALEAFLGDLTEVYFAGHAPSGHLVLPEFKRFYFRSHFVGNKEIFEASKYRDYAWVSKDELKEYVTDTEMELLLHMLPHF